MESEDPAAPFEGPEKLLEIWFSPPHTTSSNPRGGLRAIDSSIWEEMLDIVKCKVLNRIEGEEIDAYLLSESSLFISAHRLILKTCGTTLNLLGLPRILEIAASAGLSTVYRCFYSRKSFMFPERQSGPHRDWKHEVEFLDNIFNNGAAYIVGKMNGDHWLLYMTTPKSVEYRGSDPAPSPSVHLNGCTPETVPDYTIEILMSDLSQEARQPFFADLSDSTSPLEHARDLSDSLGITGIFPLERTRLDAYSFSPCGYSSNALISWSHQISDRLVSGEGYYTIHVTPEDGWSYASFECNVPLHLHQSPGEVSDLHTLVRRVVSIFQPGRLSLTLFISSEENEATTSGGESAPTGGKKYRRTDKINYEFGGYDLAFASFEAC
ncbi:S-adenosylmethionine decarboxylase [Flagelloscypha sp. PMI_526]|nr:S-adenosylmethionine decarboxylase [Flagelloscypha sp. PMI_526]